MKESEMYDKLKKELKGFKIFLHRIENRTGGIPDIYFCSKHNNGWIELKNIETIKRGNVLNIPFRTGQLSWIRNHLGYNDQIYLIGTVKNKWFMKIGSAINDYYIIHDIWFLNVRQIVHNFITAIQL